MAPSPSHYSVTAMVAWLLPPSGTTKYSEHFLITSLKPFGLSHPLSEVGGWKMWIPICSTGCQPPNL
ncbi:hypothetical protein OPV22_013199 [Ensete ventricosum]|uniref:Uncharacterized protein n=1 Tax=Ensete ventricosum TaxID=4639 RepID=A0AAV8R0H7_ENSVE|nr:hypothetical protein OPV22_013199 [Ensete ventricosum]